MMKKIPWFMLLVCAGLALPGSASEKPKSKPSALRVWFQHLKEGLSESAVSGYQQKSRVTAVAAVRGAQQDSVEPGKPQWKGGSKAKKAQALKKERTEFAKAVDLVLEGKTEEGAAALDSFEKAHPKSVLLPEVREARQKVKEMEPAQGETAPPQKAE